LLIKVVIKFIKEHINKFNLGEKDVIKGDEEVDIFEDDDHNSNPFNRTPSTPKEYNNEESK
jgi:hypothetical protein